MRSSALTIYLDNELADLLSKASRKSAKKKNEIACEALRRQLILDQTGSIMSQRKAAADIPEFPDNDNIFEILLR